MVKELPKIQIGKKTYFIDKSLGEIRNINNPHDFESVSQEVIGYWLSHNIKKI